MVSFLRYGVPIISGFAFAGRSIVEASDMKDDLDSFGVVDEMYEKLSDYQGKYPGSVKLLQQCCKEKNIDPHLIGIVIGKDTFSSNADYQYKSLLRFKTDLMSKCEESLTENNQIVINQALAHFGHELQHTQQRKYKQLVEWGFLNAGSFCLSKALQVRRPDLFVGSFLLGVFGYFIYNNKLYKKWAEYDADINMSNNSVVLKADADFYKATKNYSKVGFELLKKYPNNTFKDNALREIRYFIEDPDEHPHNLTRAYYLERRAKELKKQNKQLEVE
jgi:hypothetical protein